MAALRSGRDVSAARPSGSESLAPYPSRIAGRKAPATNADLRLKAAGMEPTNALTGLGSCRLTPSLTPSVAHSALAFQGPDRRCPDALRRLRSPARGGRRGAALGLRGIDAPGGDPKGLRAVRSPRIELSFVPGSICASTALQKA